MIFPVPVLLHESVQEIVPYTISGHVMETLNYPGTVERIIFEDIKFRGYSKFHFK